jgi:hypothetical protein
VLPADRAFGFCAALTLWQGGLFMFLFLRALGARSAAALCGALAFQFHGVAVVWLMMPGWAATCLWAPLPLWCLERACQTRRWPWAAGCATAFGLQLMAGQPQFAAYAALVLFAYGAFRGLQALARRDPHQSRIAFAALGLCATLGLGLAALHVLPVLELAGMAHRPPLSWAQVASRCFHIRQAFALLAPNFFGSQVDYNYWGDVGIGAGLNYIETCAYIGVPTLILAGLALAWDRRPVVWLLAAVAAVGLLFAFRSGAGWLLFQLPFFDRLSGVGRVILIFCLATPVLAGLGAEQLARRWEASSNALRRAAGVVAAASAAAGLAMALYVWTVGPALAGAIPAFYAYEARQIAIFAAWAVATIGLLLVGRHVGTRAALPLLAGIIAADMFVFGVRFNPATPRAMLHLQSPAVEQMRANRDLGHMVSLGTHDERGFLNRMAPNLPMAYGLSDIQASDSLRTGRWEQFLRAMADPQSPALRQPDPASPLLDLAAVRYVYTPRALDVPGLELIDAREGNLYLNQDACPRARCATRAAFVSTAGEAREAVLTPSFDPAETLVVVGPQTRPRTALRRVQQPARLTEASPNRTVVEGPMGPGWLLLADAYYPGWRASVDGEAAPVLEADWVLRAIPLPRRAQHVEFVYLPGSFAVGQFVTLLSATALVAIALATWRPKRHNRLTPGRPR